MAICYDKLWKLLIDKKMNRTELKEASGISFNVLARLGKNEPVSFESIEKICFTLNCKIEDVVEIKKEESPQIDIDAFTTIELFAGAGGLALGIEKAGFEPLGLIEFDKDAAESLKTNRPNWRVIHDDIANISCLDLEDYFGIKKGELDLLSGGAPCQAFSYAGKRLGLEDARGTLFYHYATFLQKLQPKMFLFENVRGLLTHDKGRTYATITNIFEQAGYTIQKKVLNAWDFGVPQKRERLITVGIRNDLVGKVSFSFPKEHNYKPVLRDILLDCPEGPGVPYGENKRKIFELVPPGGYWRDIDPEIAKAYMKSCWDMEGGRTGILRRMSLDEPSLTVLTSPSQKQTERCHPLEARPFTVRENARCQTFPDEWQFCGSVQSQYKQVGNAVPVNLAYEIGLEIHKSLEGVKKMVWNLDFISEEDFKKHVRATIMKYGEKLESYDLKRFNSNLIDPIKLIFDKSVYRTSWEEIVNNEIFRQRDKSNNNDIGYFHQNIFSYFKGCEVPQAGWDVIYRNPDGIQMPDGDIVHTIYVEMKNKHNTMNSASSAKTYIKMQGQILEDDDCACLLVEAIAKKSQNIKWSTKVDGKNVQHRLIRRVSMDQFYAILTGEEDAFYKMCMALPEIINSVVNEEGGVEVPHDTVIDELRKVASLYGDENDELSMAMAVYMLGFNTYMGFGDKIRGELGEDKDGMLKRIYEYVKRLK